MTHDISLHGIPLDLSWFAECKRCGRATKESGAWKAGVLVRELNRRWTPCGEPAPEELEQRRARNQEWWHIGRTA